MKTALAYPSLLDEGRRVLITEAQSLLMMADQLGESFERAVHLLAQTKGRVIVGGMGKSGHIARKIAATFVSTGTLAHFIHPAEASHGDMGMVTSQDTLLLLSNSGETKELSDIIHYAKRHSIPFVAITSGPDSALATASDVCLVLPPHDEVCPMGLAPTTSTTLMLALGDALAVVLLGQRGFSKQDYHGLHPGGKLGQSLKRVGDIMRPLDELPLISDACSMGDAIIEMSAKGFGCVGVIDAERRIIGIITDGDLRRHMAPDLLAKPVVSIMTKNPMTIAPHLLAATALNAMNKKNITSLFVTHDGGHPFSPIGLIRLHDCLDKGIA